MAAGPAVVGSLRTVVGFRGIFLIAAGSAGVAAILTRGLRGADAAHVQQREDRPTGTAGIAASGIRLVLATVAVFGFLDLVNNLLYGALEPTLPLQLQHRFGNGIWTTSGLFTAGLLVFAVVSARAGRLVERSSPLTLGELGLLAAAVALAALSVAGYLLTIGAAFLVFMGTQAILYVCSRRQVAALSAEHQGRAFGFFGTISDAGFVIGPLAGTYLFSHVGPHSFAALAAVACCGAGGLVVAGRVLGRQAEFRRLGAPRASTEASR
jgi:MFS family permease